MNECIFRGYFNSLAPRGAILTTINIIRAAPAFQLTRPARGDPSYRISDRQHTEISTHSPREGRSSVTYDGIEAIKDFNSLAPRGAILPSYLKPRIDKMISTHSPREGRSLLQLPSPCSLLYFNSLAPRGAIQVQCSYRGAFCQFQLTRPASGDPLDVEYGVIAVHISTHSPREGRSGTAQRVDGRLYDFNSLAPRGAIRGVPDEVVSEV